MQRCNFFKVVSGKNSSVPMIFRLLVWRIYHWLLKLRIGESREKKKNNKQTRVLWCRSRTYDLQINSSTAPPPRKRRLGKSRESRKNPRAANKEFPITNSGTLSLKLRKLERAGSLIKIKNKIMVKELWLLYIQ